MCEWFGWVQGSDRPATYVHLSGRNIDSKYDQMHGIETEEEPEKSKLSPKECSRCKAKNDPKASFCQNCGQALTTEAYEKVEEGKKWIETLESQKVEAEGSLDSILEQMVERKIKQMK